MFIVAELVSLNRGVVIHKQILVFLFIALDLVECISKFKGILIDFMPKYLKAVAMTTEKPTAEQA